MFLQIAAANKILIPAASAMKFPVLAVTYSNGQRLKLPITPNSNEVDTESLAVPKVSLVCLSFRASSQVQKILPRFCYILPTDSRMFAFMKH